VLRQRGCCGTTRAWRVSACKKGERKMWRAKQGWRGVVLCCAVLCCACAVHVCAALHVWRCECGVIRAGHACKICVRRVECWAKVRCVQDRGMLTAPRLSFYCSPLIDAPDCDSHYRDALIPSPTFRNPFLLAPIPSLTYRPPAPPRADSGPSRETSLAPSPVIKSCPSSASHAILSCSTIWSRRHRSDCLCACASRPRGVSL